MSKITHETTFIHAQVIINNTKTHNSTSLTLVGACVMCISIWQISFKLLCKGKIKYRKFHGVLETLIENQSCFTKSFM